MLQKFVPFPPGNQAGIFIRECLNVLSVLFSLVVTCWERADLFAVVCVVFCHFPKFVLVHTRIKAEVGTVKLV